MHIALFLIRDGTRPDMWDVHTWIYAIVREDDLLE
jgi:hypothetical protein